MALKKKDLASMDGTTALVALLAEKLLQDEDKKAQGKRFDNIEAKVEWEGSHIVLPLDPAKMTYAEAQKWLARLEKDENEQINVREIVDAFPYDGAVAFMKALKRIYGWATPVPPQSFFEAPPTMMSVDVGPYEKTTIIWGRFAIPGLAGTLMCSMAFLEGRPVFCITGQTIKKHLPAVHEVAELARTIVREESIYRGKAIRLLVDDKGNINFNEPPKFIDTTKVVASELVFSSELTEQIATNLFTPIVHTTMCRKHRIPLKRGVLLEGPYGTGKTLCANVTAQKCEQHGWTFITVERVAALKSALYMAAMYQPCVIFVEDIDREVAGERTPEIDAILNTVDGIVSKGKEIITVLTSNNAEAINQAMMRPGRLDAILRIDPPDAEAAERLMRIYGRGLIRPETELVAAKEALAGQIPAVIRECVERSKLYAISRGANGDFSIEDADIAHAAFGMKRHLELLRGKLPDPESDEHKLGKALVQCVSRGLANGDSNSLYAVTKRIHEDVETVRREIVGS